MILPHLKDLHPGDVTYWLHVEAAVCRLVHAAKFRVNFFVEPTPKKDIECAGNSSLYGQCRYHGRGEFTLRITPRFYCKGQWQGRVPLWALLDTIAHEVAHAKVGYDADHGPAFFRAFARMILLSEKVGVRKIIVDGAKK